MGVAALISWLVTAFVGLYLLAVWLIENDVTHRGAAASRLPGPVILGHVLLVLAGLVVWVLYLLTDSAADGWAAVVILAAIATLGLTMLTRWIRSTACSCWPNRARARVGGVRLPGRTGLPRARRCQPRPARRRHHHPGAAHRARGRGKLIPGRWFPPGIAHSSGLQVDMPWCRWGCPVARPVRGRCSARRG
jgi:hypothetical protein